jgi:hypothetical protein
MFSPRSIAQFQAAASLRPQLAQMEERITVDSAVKRSLESRKPSRHLARVKESVDDLSREIESLRVGSDTRRRSFALTKNDQIRQSAHSEPLDVSILRHSIATAIATDAPVPEEEEEESPPAPRAPSADRTLRVEDITSASGSPRGTGAGQSKLWSPAVARRIRTRNAASIIEHVERLRKPPLPRDPPPEAVVLPNPPALTPSMHRLSLLLNDEIDQILASA